MSQPLPQDFAPFQPASPPPPMRKRSGAVTVVAVMVLLLAILVILNESLLKIKAVMVSGNVRISREEVILAAGLDRPVSYFSVNEKKIAQGIESNRYLKFVGLEKFFPDRLTLYVEERQPMVQVQEMGADYFLADDGMVLERKGRDEKQAPAGINLDAMIVVTGLKPKEMRVGRFMIAGSTAHMEAYVQLLDELEQQRFSSEISELNVTNPESLYLVTRDGYTAHLGDLSELRAKIGTVRAVVYRLREMGKVGGRLEASIPGEVIYTPASP